MIVPPENLVGASVYEKAEMVLKGVIFGVILPDCPVAAKAPDK